MIWHYIIWITSIIGLVISLYLIIKGFIQLRNEKIESIINGERGLKTSKKLLDKLEKKLSKRFTEKEIETIEKIAILKITGGEKLEKSKKNKTK